VRTAERLGKNSTGRLFALVSARPRHPPRLRRQGLRVHLEPFYGGGGRDIEANDELESGAAERALRAAVATTPDPGSMSVCP